MNALVCSGSEALCPHGAATWMKRRHTQHPKAMHGQPPSKWQWQWQCSRKIVRLPQPPVLHAAGKGFGISVGEQYRRRGEEEGEETYKKDDEGDVNNEDDDAIPEVVFERMLGRVVFFVVSPMALGLGLLYVLGVLKERQLWEAPVWLQLLTILLAFGTSSLGLAYGTLSTNWDPDGKGSLLGWEEARKNWPELWKESPKSKR